MGVCGVVVVACVSVLCVFVRARARVCMRVCACLCVVQLCKVCASSVLAFAVVHLLLLAYVCMYLRPLHLRSLLLRSPYYQALPMLEFMVFTAIAFEHACSYKPPVHCQ